MAGVERKRRKSCNKFDGAASKGETFEAIP